MSAAQQDEDLALARRLLGPKPDAALALAEQMLLATPDHLEVRFIRAAALRRTGAADVAKLALVPLAAQHPKAWGVQFELGAALALLGETKPAIAALTRACALNPKSSLAWHALGDQSALLGDQVEADAAQSRTVPGSLNDQALHEAARLLFGGATGPAEAMLQERFGFYLTDLLAAMLLADAGERLGLQPAVDRFLDTWRDRAPRYTWRDWAPRFAPLRQRCAVSLRGAAIRRAEAPYDAAANRRFVRRSIATFTPAFFAARDGLGDPTEGPIFVIGLPRSGSTLVEQILASHSAVEGLSELPDLTMLAGDLAARLDGERGVYPASLAALDPAAFRTLGGAYLERARLYRREGRPFFVDKFPGNFTHLGLIKLILPKARIIDVRRDPMAGCFSVFKQHFAQGQAYSYDLQDLGLYYTDYLQLMAHFDRVAPGWVHRVAYESLVDDPESTIRHLLSACGLPFEASCLRFYENPRAVRTASSEQVRRPISKAGVDHWRRFEPWLQPLKAALARPFAEDAG